MFRTATTAPARGFATLAPKPTSKRTKTRQFLSPGIPSTRLTRKQTRDPGHNHILAANQDVSRRERHFRRCLAQAVTVGTPQNPDVNQFVPPYWLKVEGVRDGNDKMKQPHGFDPVIQSASNNRLVRAFVASRDARTMDALKHRGTVSEADLAQITEMEERQANPENLPLLDRVLMEFDTTISQNSGVFQHGLNAKAVETVIGTPMHDVGRAVLDERDQVEVDQKRIAVEKIIGTATAGAKELNKLRMQRIMTVFQQHATDCGSPRVKGTFFLRIGASAN